VGPRAVGLKDVTDAAVGRSVQEVRRGRLPNRLPTIWCTGEALGCRLSSAGEITIGAGPTWSDCKSVPRADKPGTRSGGSSNGQSLAFGSRIVGVILRRLVAR
jgi:hypothetical protein